MVQADNHRETVKASLLAKAEELLAGFDGYETIHEEPDKNYISKRTYNEAGLSIVINKYRCDGLAPETMKPFIDTPIDVARVLNNRLTPNELEDHQGCKMYHMVMNMPMMMSNRSIIVAMYRGDEF